MAPSEQDLAFSSSIFALLAYYRCGSIQRCFSATDKALCHSGISVEPTQLAPIRRLLFNRLQLFGIIESSDILGQRRWCIGENRLVRLRDGSTFPIGDSGFVARAHNCFLQERSSYHVFYSFPRSTGTTLKLCVEQFNLNDKEVSKLALELDCPVFELRSRWLVGLLPTVADVYEALVVPGIDPTQIDVSTELKRFDERKREWIDANTRELGAGLYCIPHIFGHHRYMVFKEGAKSLIGFDITSRDWSLLLSTYLLGKELDWQYRVTNRVVSIPAWQVSMLPMLVKRVLCVGTLKWPDLADGSYQFANVEPEVKQGLIARYPMIGVQDV